MLGSLNTITSVGIFTVAHHLNSVSGLFFSSINTSARPLIAELHDRGDWQQMGRLYQTATKWSLTFYLPVFLAMVLFPAPILSIFGESFTGGAMALVILTWAELVNVGTGMGGIILEMTGYTNLKLVNSVVRIVLYLGLNWLLIPQWGIVGAAIAALVGEGVINLLRLLQVFILFRMLPYNKSFVKPIAAGLVMLAAVWAINQYFPVTTNLVYAVFTIPILFAVYGGMTLLLGLSTEDRLILSRVRLRSSSLFSKR